MKTIALLVLLTVAGTLVWWTVASRSQRAGAQGAPIAPPAVPLTPPAASDPDLIRKVDTRSAVTPADLGLTEFFFDLPVRPRDKLTIYFQVFADGKFSKDFSRCLLYRPGSDDGNTCRVGVKMFDPNRLLPPEMKTTKRRLSLCVTCSETPFWLEHKFEWGGINSGWNGPKRLTDSTCVSLGTLSLDVWEPEGPVSPVKSIRNAKAAYRVEIFAKREPMTVAEAEKHKTIAGSLTSLPFKEPVEAP